jgi:uncharacterized membrane protein
MKTMLLACVCFIVLSADRCADVSGKHAGKVAPVETSTAAAPDSVDFTRHIQPILEKRCSPCHFTGGKMYERMPFDSSQTILSHKEGILKRIKEATENTLIKSYIEARAKNIVNKPVSH